MPFSVNCIVNENRPNRIKKLKENENCAFHKKISVRLTFSLCAQKRSAIVAYIVAGLSGACWRKQSSYLFFFSDILLQNRALLSSLSPDIVPGAYNNQGETMCKCCLLAAAGIVPLRDKTKQFFCHNLAQKASWHRAAHSFLPANEMIYLQITSNCVCVCVRRSNGFFF